MMLFLFTPKNIVLVFLILSQSILYTCFPRSSNQRAHNFHAQWAIKHITVDNGLSNNFVNSIANDKNGYLWFATIHGLNKYNGISIKKYFHDSKKPNSINSNYISSLYLDSDNTLWVGTSLGLQYYNDRKDNFVSIPLPDGKPSREIFSITEDRNKHLLIGTSSGMFSLNLLNNEITFIDVNKLGVKNDSIYRIVVTKDDNLWFTSYQQGLYFFNRENNTIKQFKKNKDNPKSLSDNWIFHLYIDTDNQLWVGTYNSGICKFNHSDSTFTRYLIDPNYEFTKRIRTIFEDRYNRLFFGSREGLFLFDKDKEEFSLYALNTHEISKLSQNSITCNFIDNGGILWLGTHSGGVNQINMYQNEFVKYPSIPNNKSFLSNSAVHCFAETAAKLYIGTEKGLNILDKKNNSFTYLRNVPDDKASLSYDDIKEIAVETDNRIWIATNRGGLNLMDKSNKVVQCYRHNPNNKNSLPSDNLYNVFVDNKKELWLLSNPDWDRANSVLTRFDRKSQTFTHYHKDFFMCIKQVNDSILLIGGMSGFYYLNKNREEFVAVENDSLIYRTMTLYMDKNHNVWIGNTLGLTKYDAKSNRFENIMTKIGLSIAEVYGILEHGNSLWISTNNGLIEIEDIYSNGDLSYRIFDKNDGLQSREFNYNAYMKTADNRFYFGGDNGFNYFYPEKIKTNPFYPQVHFSSIMVSGKEIKPDDNSGSPIVPLIDQTIDYTKEISLRYNTGSITISFDALHFSNSVSNSYKYKLEGLDDDWNYANAYNNYVTYHKLNPGKYKLIVYSISPNGIESKAPAVLLMKIHPPYWKTTWFKLIIVAIILFLTYFIIHLRTKYLHKQKKLLQQTVEEKTIELANSNKALKERQELILNQNEEIWTQNDTIHDKNKLLEHLYNRAIQLNQLGAELTATLDIDSINRKVFDHSRNMFPLTTFGIGICKNQQIVFDFLFENGKKQPQTSINLAEKESCATKCFAENKTIVINNTQSKNSPYECKPLSILSTTKIRSQIFVPLNINSKKVGVLTLQSALENAYESPHDITLIQSIAAFIAIAIDNSNAYKLIGKQNKDLEKHRMHLEDMVTKRTLALEEEKIKAEESDRLKSAFLANMSHEIRTPLNAIIGFIDIIETNSDGQNSKYYEVIRKSSYSLLNLIEDIIDFSRIESGTIEISPTEVNINTLINNTFKEFEKAVSDNNEDLNQNVEIILKNKIPINDLIINTDQHRLAQIFSNLLTNAIKFTHEGKITFGLQEINKNLYTFYVDDTGIGFEINEHTEVFERFRKLDHKTERLYRGGGLGLSISKNLAELLGGTIWVESEIRKGSTFFFNIKDMSAPSLNSPNKNNAICKVIETPDWSKHKVLIVEDENTNYELLKSILEKTNISILHATNGKEAIITFMQNQDSIDIVLMDLKLPILSGYEASKIIKRIKDHIPIIAQSAYATDEDKKKIQQSVLDDYVTKPISANILISKMEAYITNTTDIS